MVVGLGTGSTVDWPLHHRHAELIEPGMVIGLGTGYTVDHTLDSIGGLLRHRVLSDIARIPTSKQTNVHTSALNIPLPNLGTHPIVNLSIDGADKVDPEPNLVKGREGSLLHEKMIEADGLPE